MNSTPVSWRSGILFRLILLTVLIMALAPALPAAADDPEAEAAAPGGDVSAGHITPQAKKVFPYDGQGGDEYGWAVAISGDFMLVGALDFSLGDATHEGAAYLYGRNVGGPNQWGLVKKFSYPGADEGANFGSSVAIQGTTLVIGASSAYVAATDAEDGLAYVYEQDAGGVGQWGQTAILSGTLAGMKVDAFGASVALYGSTIVVGAYMTGPEAGGDAPGAAYIFGRNVGGPGAWGRVKMLTPSDVVDRAAFGAAVVLYGSTLAVGAPGANAGLIGAAGAVYLFGRDAGGSGNWGETKKIVANVPISNSMFGYSVALTANTLVVGAPYAALNDIPVAGAAYIFERNAGGAGYWGQVKQLSHPEATRQMYGYSVAASEATVVVGHVLNTGGSEGGEAHVYSRDAGGTDQWGEVAILSDSANEGFDGMGSAVDVEGLTIVVGAFVAPGRFVGGYPERSGAAYIFTPYALRVNSAGPKVVDTAGNVWVADRGWLAGTTPWGFIGGIGRVVSAPIANTDDDKLYQSERLWSGAAKPGYKFVVPNGRYMLTFKFSETYWSAAGQRKFTVMAEGKLCFANYDPYIAAGGVKNKAAPDKVCYIDVTDKLLSVDFISVIGQAKVDAIYIQQLYQ